MPGQFTKSQLDALAALHKGIVGVVHAQTNFGHGVQLDTQEPIFDYTFGDGTTLRLQNSTDDVDTNGNPQSFTVVAGTGIKNTALTPGKTAGTAPTTRTVGGQLEQYDPTTGQWNPAPGAPEGNVPAADQLMPGTDTSGGLNASNPAMGDTLNPGDTVTQNSPGVTVGQSDALVRQQQAATSAANAANTAKNDAAARAISQQNANTSAAAQANTASNDAARLALDQTTQELTQGQRAITNAYNNNVLSLDQAKAAADLLYKQADIELRARIADQTYGQTVAAEQMKRLPAGTLAASAQGWQSALTGKYTPPTYPVDNRDPTQIALQAIQELHAGQGPSPAMQALSQASPQGLTLPQPGAQSSSAASTSPVVANSPQMPPLGRPTYPP